jgi:hypothetical protein
MQRSRRLFFACALAAGATPFGCSLVVDTSGLTSVATEDAAGDRASGTDGGADGASLDALTDALTADGGTVCDATFCDDFDDGPVGAKWSRSIVNQGAIDLSTKYTSAPSALRARFFGSQSTDDRYAMLERDLGTGTRVHCEFSMYVTARADKDVNDPFRIRTTAAGISDYLLYLVLPSTGGIALADDIHYADGGCACPQKFATFDPFPVGAWRRITVETDFTTATLSVDGAVVVTSTFGPIVPDGPIVVGLGGRAFSSITSDTLFDDFSCTITK